MIARKDTRGSSSACTRGSRSCTQQNVHREQGGAVSESSGLSTLAPRTRCRPPPNDVPHRNACSEPKIAGI
ncbi:hypothetical protein T484DRAFT_1989735 [Baffinella frigidus]|nr:hypothetical protein T484DRAFT_1989735 [Cryptophyta sp. CCMP2293]